MDCTLQNPISEDLQRLSEYAQQRNLPLVICTDSNAHSTLWGCPPERGTNAAKRGEALEEWLISQTLDLANVGTENTFVSAVGQSIIDLTIHSPGGELQVPHSSRIR